MGVVLVDLPNAGRVRVSRPASPGSPLWWVRLRGALSIAVPPHGQRAGRGGDIALSVPAVLYDHTPPSLRAVGRVVDRVRQTHL